MAYSMIENIKDLLQQRDELKKFTQNSLPMNQEEIALESEETTRQESEIRKKLKEMDLHIKNLDFDVNEVDDTTGFTCLMYFIHYLPDFAERLILFIMKKQGNTDNLSMFSKIDKNECTALMYAFDRGQSKIASLLIDSGYSNEGQVGKIYVTQESGEVQMLVGTALIVSLAAMSKQKYRTIQMQNTIIKLIHTKKANIGYASSDIGVTALITACIFRLQNIAIELIKTGQSKPNYADTKKNTALIYACMQNLKAVVRELLKTTEVNVNHIGDYGRTPLIWTCIDTCTDNCMATCMYMGMEECMEDCMDACMENKVNIFHQLMNKGVDVTILDVYEKSASHYAKQNNEMDMFVDLIIEVKLKKYPFLTYIDRNSKGTDIVDSKNNELTVIEYLQKDNNDHICFVMNSETNRGDPQVYYSSYTILQTLLLDRSQIKLECFNDNNDISETNLNTKHLFFNLAAIIPIQGLVLHVDIIETIEKQKYPENVKVENRCFSIIEVDNVKSIMSMNYYDIISATDDENVLVPISSDHCQEDKKNTVYGLSMAILINRNPILSNKPASRNRSSSTTTPSHPSTEGNLTIMYKSETQTLNGVPDITTYRDLKNMIVEKWTSLEKLEANKKYNINYVILGRVERENELDLDAVLPKKYYDNTAQAMITEKRSLETNDDSSMQTTKRRKSGGRNKRKQTAKRKKR